MGGRKKIGPLMILKMVGVSETQGMGGGGNERERWRGLTPEHVRGASVLP